MPSRTPSSRGMGAEVGHRVANGRVREEPALPGCPDGPPSEVVFLTREPDIASQSAEGAVCGTSRMLRGSSSCAVSHAELGHRVDIAPPGPALPGQDETQRSGWPYGWRVAIGRPETVTVLFTDLVGSTAWRVRVGDAVADARMAELERASREVVESAGGSVVKGVGDGVMATFTSAVVAVDVAAVLQGVAGRLGVCGTRACLRVGVSTGELVREGDDWLGAAAIEASRLCAEAEGGAVLVADVTARLSRGRTEHTMRSVGEHTLRGFDSPVEVFELVVASAAPVPPPLVRAAESPMVGRQAELRRMGMVLAAVQAGGSETLLVVGEPGVGKTRLVAALAFDAAERGFTVMFGRCDEVVARHTSRSLKRSHHGWLTCRAQRSSASPAAAGTRCDCSGRTSLAIRPECR